MISIQLTAFRWAGEAICILQVDMNRFACYRVHIRKIKNPLIRLSTLNMPLRQVKLSKQITPSYFITFLLSNIVSKTTPKTKALSSAK